MCQTDTEIMNTGLPVGGLGVTLRSITASIIDLHTQKIDLDALNRLVDIVTIHILFVRVVNSAELVGDVDHRTTY